MPALGLPPHQLPTASLSPLHTDLQPHRPFPCFLKNAMLPHPHPQHPLCLANSCSPFRSRSKPHFLTEAVPEPRLGRCPLTQPTPGGSSLAFLVSSLGCCRLSHRSRSCGGRHSVAPCGLCSAAQVWGRVIPPSTLWMGREGNPKMRSTGTGLVLKHPQVHTPNSQEPQATHSPDWKGVSRQFLTLSQGPAAGTDFWTPPRQPPTQWPW